MAVPAETVGGSVEQCSLKFKPEQNNTAKNRHNFFFIKDCVSWCEILNISRGQEAQLDAAKQRPKGCRRAAPSSGHTL